MGWTSRTHNNGIKFNRQDLKQEIINMEFMGHEVKSIAIPNNREAYVVYKGNDGKYHMCVCLFENRKDSFAIKSMSEDMGPFYYNAPKYQIKQLDKTTDRQALNWRAEVMTRFATNA